MNFYTLYRAHNYHFKIYGAMFLGQQRTALDTADQLAAAIPEDLLRVTNPPMADWLEGFVPMRLHVLIRFGRWADILAVAGAMLDGELEYRKGNHDTAFALLRRAVELDDGLPYDEPWGWMQPARHALGALLLEQGRLAEAEAVYRADLGLDDTLTRACQHPGNVWSLHGYHECLVRLGKHEQAGIVFQQLKIAAARADVPIRSSCYCRRTA